MLQLLRVLALINIIQQKMRKKGNKCLCKDKKKRITLGLGLGGLCVHVRVRVRIRMILGFRLRVEST